MRFLKTQFQICFIHFFNDHEISVLDNESNLIVFNKAVFNNSFSLLSNQTLKKLRFDLFNKYASNRIEPFNHALNFLISANILEDRPIADLYYTRLPAVAMSAFSCELYLKAWVVEDKNDFLKSKVYKGITHVRYLGSDARPFLRLNNINGSGSHNLSKLFTALPNDVRDFHEIIYKVLYEPILGHSLNDALKIVENYFFNVRYYFEDISKQYDLELINSLANFFNETVMFLKDWDGKLYLENN